MVEATQENAVKALRIINEIAFGFKVNAIASNYDRGENGPVCPDFQDYILAMADIQDYANSVLDGKNPRLPSTLSAIRAWPRRGESDEEWLKRLKKQRMKDGIDVDETV